MVATDEPITAPRPPWCVWPPYEGQRDGAKKLWDLSDLGKELPIPGYARGSTLHPAVPLSNLRISLGIAEREGRPLGLGWLKAILLTCNGIITHAATNTATAYAKVTLRGEQRLGLVERSGDHGLLCGPAPENGYHKTALVLLVRLLACEDTEVRMAMRAALDALCLELDAAQHDAGYARPRPGTGMPLVRILHAMGPAPFGGSMAPTPTRLAAEFAADQLAMLSLYSGRTRATPRPIAIQDALPPPPDLLGARYALSLEDLLPWPYTGGVFDPVPVPPGMTGHSRAEARGITTPRPSSATPGPVLFPAEPVTIIAEPPAGAIDMHPLPPVVADAPSAPTEGDIIAVTPDVIVTSWATAPPPSAASATGPLYLALACVPYIERGCADPGPFLMKGPSGTGKTALAGYFTKQAAETCGGRVTTIPGRPGAEAADLLGGFAPVPDEGGSSRLIFVNGALTHAFRDVLTNDRWNAVIFEEVPRNSQEVTNLIMEVCNVWSRADIEAAGQQIVRESASDSYYKLELTYTGETLVVPQEKMKFILTGNFGSRYVQASGLDEAARGRMSGGWYEVTLSREELRAIVAYKLNLSPGGVIVNVLLGVTRRVQDYELSLPGKLTQTLNLRNLLAWGSKAKDYSLQMSQRDALLTSAQLTWVDMLAPEKGATVDPDIRRQLLEMVEAASSAAGA